MTQKLAKFLVFLFMRLVGQVDIDGLENAPQGCGFIVASNHLGRLDVPLVYVFLKRNDITLMVAEKYHKYAIFRWFVKHLDCLWVDRFNADFNTVRTALNRLKQGGILVIAPEGTRSKTEALIEAWSGSSYLAAKTGAPVVPVALTGTEDRLVVQQLKRLRRPRIHIQVGKPFTLPSIKGQDREQALQQYTDEIMCQIAVLLPPEKRGFYTDHPRTLELLKEKGICSV